jgi:hypothetical protein
MPSHPLAAHEYLPGEIDAALEFLKRTRGELRTLRRVRVWKDRVQVFDVNGDYFEVCGLGYADAEVTRLLQAVNTVFEPETIHRPVERPFKEYKTGRRHPWAEDRVM